MVEAGYCSGRTRQRNTRKFCGMTDVNTLLRMYRTTSGAVSSDMQGGRVGLRHCRQREGPRPRPKEAHRGAGRVVVVRGCGRSRGEKERKQDCGVEEKAHGWWKLCPSLSLKGRLGLWRTRTTKIYIIGGKKLKGEKTQKRFLRVPLFTHGVLSPETAALHRHRIGPEMPDVSSHHLRQQRVTATERRVHTRVER